MRKIPKPPFSEDLRTECRAKLLSSVAELTGQSSSIKSGEIPHANPPRAMCSEQCEGTNEKAPRATGVSSNGEFWILHVLETTRKLESMPKSVHLAFPIDDEDEAGNKLTDKAQETLTRLKAVCRTLAMDIIPVIYCICRLKTRTNTLSVVPSCFWLEPPYNSIAPLVKRRTMRVRMDEM